MNDRERVKAKCDEMWKRLGELEANPPQPSYYSLMDMPSYPGLVASEKGMPEDFWERNPFGRLNEKIIASKR